MLRGYVWWRLETDSGVWVAGPGVGVPDVPGAEAADHVHDAPGADLHDRVNDVHPREQGEQEEEDHGEQLPAGQRLLGFLTELKVDQEYYGHAALAFFIKPRTILKLLLKFLSKLNRFC